MGTQAKTVVFTECRKFDGTDFRWLSPGEYIQMSGRAGRRGKDDRGVVVQILDEKMEPAVAKSILYGTPDSLDSSYHVTYNMLLNLLRVEGADPDYLVRSSFHQYQQESEAPELLQRAERLQRRADLIAREADAEQRAELERELEAKRSELRRVAHKPQHCVPWLQAGRLVEICAPDGWLPTAPTDTADVLTQLNSSSKSLDCELDSLFERLVDCSEEEEESSSPEARVDKAATEWAQRGRGADFGWGVVVAHRAKPRLGERFESHAQAVACGALAVDASLDECAPAHVLEVLVRCAPPKASQHLVEGSEGNAHPASTSQLPSEPRVVAVPLCAVKALSAVRVFMPLDLRRPEQRALLTTSLDEVERRFGAHKGEPLPLLDAITDMKLDDADYANASKQEQALAARLQAQPPVDQHAVHRSDLRRDLDAVLKRLGRRGSFFFRHLRTCFVGLKPTKIQKAIVFVVNTRAMPCIAPV